jgi:hypothetical protein
LLMRSFPLALFLCIVKRPRVADVFDLLEIQGFNERHELLLCLFIAVVDQSVRKEN